MPLSNPPRIVVMGVSGCGKSSVGARLAAVLDLPFVEGDRLHPKRNVQKMAAGVPLQDDDRLPWLDSIGEKLAGAARQNAGLIVSCSSLRKIYRDRLRRGSTGMVIFVFLYGDTNLLRQRLEARMEHFMPSSLLQSQLASLEDPRGEAGVIAVAISQSVDQIVAEACEGLRLMGQGCAPRCPWPVSHSPLWQQVPPSDGERGHGES